LHQCAKLRCLGEAATDARVAVTQTFVGKEKERLIATADCRGTAFTKVWEVEWSTNAAAELTDVVTNALRWRARSAEFVKGI